MTNHGIRSLQAITQYKQKPTVPNLTTSMRDSTGRTPPLPISYRSATDDFAPPFTVFQSEVKPSFFFFLFFLFLILFYCMHTSLPPGPTRRPVCPPRGLMPVGVAAFSFSSTVHRCCESDPHRNLAAACRRRYS